MESVWRERERGEEVQAFFFLPPTDLLDCICASPNVGS